MLLRSSNTLETEGGPDQRHYPLLWWQHYRSDIWAPLAPMVAKQGASTMPGQARGLRMLQLPPGTPAAALAAELRGVELET